MKGSENVSVEMISRENRELSRRDIPVEAAIAIEYNGIGYAVMMATPIDLHDFAIGFSLSERIVDNAAEIREVISTQTDNGWILRVLLPSHKMDTIVQRVRTRVSESSCGLCGLENLDQINRPLPPITSTLHVPSSAYFNALKELPEHQPLNAQTGGVHAAAFCSPDGKIILAREDVGRHNALDKLIGAMTRANLQAETGFMLLSSRCSFELVEKTAISGCSVLVTISTATSLAVTRAQSIGLTLIGLARADTMLDFSRK